MKALKNLIDNIKPTFSKGGKLSFLHSTFDAFETFLYVPEYLTKKGVHVRDSIDLKRTMTIVIIALLPALLFGMYNTGYQYNLSVGGSMDFMQMFWYGFLRVLPLVIVSYVVGLGIEFAAAQIRGHEVNEGFLVSGMLIPLIMPVDVPLWILALSVAFAVIVGKEVFGGTGMNIWNPALLSRAFVFFAYPSQISGDKIWISGLSSGQGVVDGFSGATPLANAAAGSPVPSFMDMFTGFIPGSIGETSTIAILIGAALLIFTGIASWKIMVSTFAGGLLTGLLLNVLATDPSSYMAMPAWNHLVMGGFAFGAVFMATDPVTGSQTETGKWIYGFLIGMMAILIRVFNAGYPEGMMLAILLMNTFAPLIDHIIVQSNIKRRLKRAVIK
ncbi:MAG: NADH:ubiquinone reductase (Na(+)-transporting) subunit B [Bacteroidales bacterium]|nr:NADH:ubiquinone reductase (Na(+)-transporting) subunit B [Bacteroidales bacterium]MDD4293107.1 NADH:ubiquinone reductase (Na(+)-transporting) subunit B [Bacteroidales bacterium]MDD4492462.1 NADH:ubiquinone reductase (Na(+)-transporting) subunit B [Bacteroidales bacterium]HNW49136.1 NADH:ubiquinone reductase (Na(+)-transporting) subunit B [Bacteroidales bacterium]HPS96388.1 NADH:ubiquinone reductase (Na(+)-transporting) subunit B [Bacteroidales bacterium]